MTPNLYPHPSIHVYLTLLMNCLTRVNQLERYKAIRYPQHWGKYLPWLILTTINSAASIFQLEMVQLVVTDSSSRRDGKDWPTEGETMVGIKRLENLKAAILQIQKNEVAGDIVEAGVWRGGASIFMKGVLVASGDLNRKLWLADSFEGLPKPDSWKYPEDEGSPFWKWSSVLAVSEATVRQNFEKYGLLDERVMFLKGWFKDTLPDSPIKKIALLRLDGDMYESTMDTLVSLYDRVVEGGFIVVDDYFGVPACKAAVTDFRRSRGLEGQIVRIDWTGAYWIKKSSALDV